MHNASGSPIDHVEVFALGPDLPRHAYTAHLPAPYTTSTLVTITDAEGAHGLGQYDSDSYGAFDLAPLETLRTLVPRLIGRDPLERVATWDEIRDHGTAPDMPGVRSALDIAQWDLVARRAGAPLHELIAPPATDEATVGLPAYASLPTLASPAAYADDVERYLAEGYTAFKIHAWGDAERDLFAIRAARDVAGDDVALIYDAEGCFDRPTAERMMPALGALGVRWFEAPLPDLDLEGYRRLIGSATWRSCPPATRSGTNA
jgi:L-alanine-DL-glutamate epimerase-like enolase superfamily enzyme